MGAEPEDLEGQLLLKARTDTRYFGDLYLRVERQLLQYFYRHTACPATAADLLSETMAAAIHSVRRYNPRKGTGLQWLYGIARNLLAQWQRQEGVERRSRRKVTLRVDVDSYGDLDGIEALVDFEALKPALLAALERLTPGVRDAVKLRIFDNLEYDVIAEKLDCTPGTARVRVSRGLSRLYEGLNGK